MSVFREQIEKGQLLALKDITEKMRTDLYLRPLVVKADIVKRTKHESNAVYYFSDPTNMSCFFCYLSTSLRRFCQNQHYLNEQ